MRILFGKNWTKLMIASLLMCFVFSFSALAQKDAKAPLDDDAVSTLVDELKEGLPEFIDDKEKVTAITEKWDQHEDLAGKTKGEILKLLFEDVKSVVKDNGTQVNIWKNWTGEEVNGKETQVNKPQAPTLPDKTPEKPKTPLSESEKYTKAMEAGIVMINKSITPADYVAAANTFERIGNMEKDQWLPSYYAAFCNIMAAYRQQGNERVQGELADKAETFIAKAEALAKDNSEVSCLRSMHATIMLMIDPQKNGMTFGPKQAQYIEKAMKEDPNNPRPYLLDGQSQFSTPEQWGGDKVKAKEQMQKALELFGKFKPASTIHPVWGKEQVEAFLSVFR